MLLSAAICQYLDSEAQQQIDDRCQNALTGRLSAACAFLTHCGSPDVGWCVSPWQLLEPVRLTLPVRSSTMDIWSLAKEKLRENEEKAAASEDRDGIGDGRTVKSSTHIVICGNAQSGKSVLVNKFLDRNEEPKETIALEYIYARRTRGNNKDICHIWELGGGTKLAQLLAVPLVKDNIE
ncbi:unnamed protein product [Nippostrongylus brasiliensis]|uniref:Cytoplasmic dynein 2 light intermediate chain 1 n=1 Tax=Nippostrongylus brasiliensis TaxID=27835 RepID=A0A0N4Y0A2_NIPBR|nr:unnamed protein product [Nippostrongylus brasiliensis]